MQNAWHVNNPERENMMNLEQVREALADRNAREVSRRCGVHEETIRRIKNGTAQNPSFAVMTLLIEYLEGSK